MVLPLSVVPELLVGAGAIYVLVKAAGIAVDRLTKVAQAFDVPDAVIAMTVIAIGTSLPEIGSHITASLGILSGTLEYTVASSTVIGGNMGSSTAQITLLLGLFLFGYGRLDVTQGFLRRNLIPMVLATGLTLAVAIDGVISRLDGGVLVGTFLVYSYYNYTRRERSQSIPETASTNVKRDTAVALGAIVAVLVAAFIVLNIVEILVAALGLNGSMIGVVTIGIASALPELSTVLEAIRRTAPDIAVGTLVGSNIVNPLLGIGIGGMISTYAVPPSVLIWDFPFRIVLGAVLVGYLVFVSGMSLRRRDGMTLIIAYFVYLGVRFFVVAG